MVVTTPCGCVRPPAPTPGNRLARAQLRGLYPRAIANSVSLARTDKPLTEAIIAYDSLKAKSRYRGYTREAAIRPNRTRFSLKKRFHCWRSLTFLEILSHPSGPEINP